MTFDGRQGPPEPVSVDDILRVTLAGDNRVESELDDVGRRLAVPAPNAIEWATRAEHLNSPSLFEYWRSYQTIRDYFELRCPTCNPGGCQQGEPGDCWGKTQAQLESEVLLVWSQDQSEEECPKCGTVKSQFIEDGLMSGYNQLHLVVGMRAGKSMTAAIIGTFIEHFWYALAHGSPGGIHGYLDITAAEKFEITFLASNQVQGQDTIWAKYTGFRALSPWFQRYVPWVKAQETRQVDSGLRKWRYNEGETKIVNEHPQVRTVINSLNSNSAGQAGRTRVGGFLDELGRMKQTEGAQGAAEIYRTIEASLKTTRAAIKACGAPPWIGSMVSVTSPMTRGDKAMQLLKAAAHIPDMYARHYPTWEFNPRQPRSNFDSDYKKDPVGAERDFGANPPGAEHPLIHDATAWYRLTVGEGLKPSAEFEYYNYADKTGQLYVGVRLSSALRRLNPRQASYVAWDAGKNFDAFAGCAVHPEWLFDEETETEQLVTVEDWVIRILPEPGTEVWFDSVYHVLRDLVKVQSIAEVAFDRWQSVHLIQKVRDLGIRAGEQSLENKDFLDWRGDCYAHRYRQIPPHLDDVQTIEEDGRRAVHLPLEFRQPPSQMTPYTVGYYEITALQRDPDTDRVYNSDKGKERGCNSDDVARVKVHAHRMCQKATYVKDQDDRSRKAARKRAAAGAREWGARGQAVSFGSGGRRKW